MDIIKSKLLIASLLTITICCWLLSLSAHATSRGITVKAKTSTGTEKEIQLYSGYHALVISCGNYVSGWPYLPNPVKDAKQIASMLQGWGWTVDILENPKGETLKREFNKLVTGPGKKRDKAILVWFAGHGHTIEEADGTKLGYLVPVDAPDPDKDLLEFMERAVSMRQIETVSKQIQSKHVLMAFDTCFSGAIFQTIRARPSPYIQEKVSYPVRQFITAGTENEQVPDKSIFKDLFIQGLKNRFADLNQDNYITGEEIGAFLQENVINYSRRTQHPQFGKINNPFLDKGDFVFVMNEVEELPLALMKIKQLEQENLKLKEQMEKTKKHPNAVKSNKEDLTYKKFNTEGKRKIAIFPIYTGNLPKDNVDDHKDFTNFVIKLTNNIPNIITTHSFYPYDSYITNYQIVDIRKLFNDKTEKNIWFGDSRYAKNKPDFNALKELSEKINSDLILIFKVELESFDPGHEIVNYRGYIVDVEKKFYYKKMGSVENLGFTDFGKIEDMTKDLFEIYKKTNSQIGTKY